MTPNTPLNYMLSGVLGKTPPLCLPLSPKAAHHCCWMKVRVTMSPPESQHWTTYHVLSPDSGDEGENNAGGTNGTSKSIGTGWYINRLPPSPSLTPACPILQIQVPWRLGQIWIPRTCTVTCCTPQRSDPLFSELMLELLTGTVSPCRPRNLAMFFAPV